jgi:hypothetical protein
MLGVVQVRTVDPGNDGQAAEIQRCGYGVDLRFLHAQFTDQQRPDVRVDVVGDLEAHGRAETAAQQLLFERLQQVFGVVLFNLNVLVAGDAERVVLQDLHAGEQLIQVNGDDFFQRDEPGHAAGHRTGARAVDGNEAGQLVRNLDAGEELFVTDRVADHHGQVQGQPRDIGERVGRIHRERSQDGEDFFREHRTELVLGLVIKLVPVHQVDVLIRQGRPDLFGVDPRMALRQAVRGVADLIQHLHGAEAGRGGDGQPGGDTAFQPGHPDHEEFVQVGGKDGEEADPLQEVEVGILGQFQHAGVEGQPAQFAVQEPVRADVAFRLKVRRELGDVDPVLRRTGSRHLGGSETGAYRQHLGFRRDGPG